MTDRAYDSLCLDVVDGVGEITLDMPQFGNALTVAGIQEFLDALFDCGRRDDVGAVLLRGAGKSFCTGFNLKEIPLAEADIEDIAKHFEVAAMWWHQVMHKIVHIECPVLVAVHGSAAGVGLGIALCADMVICRDDARFLCAWHTIGLANDATTSYSLAKIVGFRRAQELMLTNRTLSGSEAVEWGIANQVYAAAAFDDAVRRIARDLAAGPTHLQALAKESFHQGWRRSVEEATEYEIQNVMKSVRHPYFLEALNRFIAGDQKSDVEQVRLP